LPNIQTIPAVGQLVKLFHAPFLPSLSVLGILAHKAESARMPIHSPEIPPYNEDSYERHSNRIGLDMPRLI